MEGLDQFFKRSAQAWRHRAAADDYRMTSVALDRAALKYEGGASEALAGIFDTTTGVGDVAVPPLEPSGRNQRTRAPGEA